MVNEYEEIYEELCSGEPISDGCHELKKRYSHRIPKRNIN